MLKLKPNFLAKAHSNWPNRLETIYQQNFLLLETNREELTDFTDQANNHHPTIKLTAEISDTETTFLATSINKSQRFTSESELAYTLLLQTHGDILVHTSHFSPHHPIGVKKGFSKGDASDCLERIL